MFTVGITGGIATGKSLATDFFAAKDIDIIDADKISRSLQEPGEVGYEDNCKKIRNRRLSNDDQTINRSSLQNFSI